MTKQQKQDDDDIERVEGEERPFESDELQAALAELATMKDLAARAQADLQNAKDRMERNIGDMRRYAVEGTLAKLIPILDHFYRASTHLPDDLKNNEWVKGVLAIEQELSKVLAEMGLQKMENLIGQQVDPMKHEILQSAPGEEGKILEVFEDGYELLGKVLRPAKVKVGNGEGE